MEEKTPEEWQAELDKALKELAKTKDEAAARRISLREATQKLEEYEPKIQKLEEYEKAQKSEEELKTQRLQEIEEEIQNKERELKQTQFLNQALAAGVPEERAKLLSPDTFQGSAEEVAEKLKLFSEPKQPPSETPINPPREENDLTMADWAELPVQERLKSIDKLMEADDAKHTL